MVMPDLFVKREREKKTDSKKEKKPTRGVKERLNPNLNPNPNPTNPYPYPYPYPYPKPNPKPKPKPKHWLERICGIGEGRSMD